MALIKEFIHQSRKIRFYWIYDDSIIDDSYIGDFGESVISYSVVTLGVESPDQVGELVGFRLKVTGPDATYLVESGEIAIGNEHTEIAVVNLTTAPQGGFSTQFSERPV